MFLGKDTKFNNKVIGYGSDRIVDGTYGRCGISWRVRLQESLMVESILHKWIEYDVFLPNIYTSFALPKLIKVCV